VAGRSALTNIEVTITRSAQRSACQNSRVSERRPGLDLVATRDALGIVHALARAVHVASARLRTRGVALAAHRVSGGGSLGAAACAREEGERDRDARGDIHRPKGATGARGTQRATPPAAALRYRRPLQSDLDEGGEACARVRNPLGEGHGHRVESHVHRGEVPAHVVGLDSHLAPEAIHLAGLDGHLLEGRIHLARVGVHLDEEHVHLAGLDSHLLGVRVHLGEGDAHLGDKDHPSRRGTRLPR